MMEDQLRPTSSPKPRRKFQFTIAIIGSVITVVAMIMSVWLKLQDAKMANYQAEIEHMRAEQQMKVLEELRYRNDTLYSQIDQIREVYRDFRFDTISLDNGTSTKFLHMNDRIETIENKFQDLAESHYNLKRSLKPTEIEDLLTIPRLQDEVKIISEKLEDLESELARRQTSFETSIRAESKSSNQSTNLILVVLIPLIINFLYTVWKDLKEHKKNNVDVNTANK